MISAAISRPGFAARLGITAALTAAADFLLFGHPFGISLLLFAALLGVGIAIANRTPPDRRASVLWAFLAAGLLPLVENISLLSVSVAIASLGIFALAASGRLRNGLANMARQLPALALATPFRLPLDLLRWRRASRRTKGGMVRLAIVLGWLMPIVLALVFITLFAMANPVVERWVALLDPRALLALLQPLQLAFWLAVIFCVWALLRPRLPKVFQRRSTPGLSPAPGPRFAPAKTEPDRLFDTLFGRAAIFRALLIFNAIFAVETLLDIVYLWGGVALPDGMTYAEYAHRGAYPLIATALLAAGFVLLALRPGSAASADRPIRLLVYLWIAQNVVLVLSSILRLDLYIDIYMLTYWRVAAFIWMGLVAVGLLLIVARIALEKPNGWLVDANLLTLSLTLYAGCFVNFAGLIADYNVRHSLEMNGRGLPLDRSYLLSLGPAAVPALDLLIAGAVPERTADPASLRRDRDWLARRHERQTAEWRAWTFRGWRLSRYLDENMRPVPPGLPLDPR
ncbi:DUF4173 domain-containing protein [Mesorhizobium sp. LHD-90]|uniref:DUF4153 domain-containing protein n=1 Tax=Mesorhizobium sp. LHD-90 TaxID=3071414 RepID=UPI0027E17D17|nr:DUF4173 domain-containing protein [Mesorhizobium sp. LHD-90]MDQ6434233.1 DUF4173 domain-containing protein [Mesorhizobium sp. LHD-90]